MNKKLKEPKHPPQTYHFDSVNDLVNDVRLHALKKKQITIKYDYANQQWEATVYGLTL